MTEQMVQAANAAENTDRVREHSPEGVNRQLDSQARQCVQSFAGNGREEITHHIDELAREWDMERYLETNASIVALGGVLLGAAVNRRFLILPGVVFGFLFQHAVQGWCPPMPVFRKLGVRTRKEINREKYALKALRGDFDSLSHDQSRAGDAMDTSAA
jgi:hypothetical protein